MPLDPPQGLMSFPGINQIERGSFTLLQGIQPSLGTLEIEPQDPRSIPLDGDLVISYFPAMRKPIVFKNCRIDKASFEYGPDGMVWRLSFLDRRWRWRFAGDGTPGNSGGPVSGWFNQRFASIQPAPQQDDSMGTYQLGSINPDSIRTPRWLAKELLNAMGEEKFDVRTLSDQIDEGPLPEVVWDMDLPAVALQELCERLGCRVVLNLDDSISVVRLGIGKELPTNDIERLSVVLDPPDVPESVIVVGGRSRYQVDLLLVPVGLDVDGTIREIWKLSYAPTQLLVPPGQQTPQADNKNLGGWGLVNPDPDVGFGEIPGWETDLVIPPLTPPNIQNAWQVGGLSPKVNPRYLARQSVWRWFRIAIDTAAATLDLANPAAGPVLPPPNFFPQTIPGWKKSGTDEDQKLYALWQILPLEDTQVLGWYDNEKNWRPYEASVYGQYQAITWSSLDALGLQNLWDQNFNMTQPMPVGVNYSIDRERGLVMFEEPMVTYNQAGNPPAVWAPVLYLRTAVRPRFYDPKAQTQTQAADHYIRKRDLGDLGGTRETGPRILKREELVKQTVPVYDKTGKIVKTFDNTQALDTEADYIIDAALLEYQTLTPADATYMGIVAIGCDGAITQVSWSVGLEGATTRVARNTEVHYNVPSYRERLLVGSLARVTEATLAMQKQQRKA